LPISSDRGLQAVLRRIGFKATCLKNHAMAEVTIKESVWKKLVQVARLRRKTPEVLADVALREFLRREADEELLERSSRAARGTAFSLGQTEEIIRQHRQRKKSR
jgi:hypothetical protein